MNAPRVPGFPAHDVPDQRAPMSDAGVHVRGLVFTNKADPTQAMFQMQVYPVPVDEQVLMGLQDAMATAANEYLKAQEIVSDAPMVDLLPLLARTEGPTQ